MKAVWEVGRLISCPSKIAMKNCPCIDGLPIKHGDFPLSILNYQRVPFLFGLIIRSRWSNQNIWNTFQTYPILGFNTTIKGISPAKTWGFKELCSSIRTGFNPPVVQGLKGHRLMISPPFPLHRLVWFQPLWKRWLRQLGWWHSQYIYTYIHIYGKS